MKQEFAFVGFLKAARAGSPVLWHSSLAMFVGMVVCFALPLFDARLIAGINVWEKPAKFFLSLAVHGVTLAWALSLVSSPVRGAKTASWIFIFAAWLEMAYIVFRASRGEQSHFNTATIEAAFFYSVMGVGALCLTATSAFLGWRLWQQRSKNIMRQATAIGLMLGAALGTLAGAYLSSRGSHWIGGDLNDASGLPFFHWSTTGGDLRVAHFVGLHATQALPLAALSGSRLLVFLMAIAFIGATFALMVWALMGMPLFSSAM
jgi:hypothetical protein